MLQCVIKSSFFSMGLTLYFRTLFRSILPAVVTSATGREIQKCSVLTISLRVFYCVWLMHWSLWLKRVAASFKRVAAFLNVQQHGKISIIHFTFILILFLPYLSWCYPIFQCVYKSSTLFLYFCLLVPLYVLSSFQYIHICCLRHNSSGCAFWT